MKTVLTTENGYRFKVIKEKDDPMTNRLSIGGSKAEGCYIVFRGNINDCEKVLEEALKAFQKVKQSKLFNSK